MADGITQAVVYLNGAQVTRTQKFNFKEGIGKAVFRDLPPGMNGRSITASSDGKCVIVSVAHSIVYEGTENKRISDMYAKLEKLKDQLSAENGMLSVLKEEEELIRKNSRMPDGKIFRPADMKDSVLFFRERMAALCEEKFAYQKKIEKISYEISEIESKIGIGRRDMTRAEVEVEVHTRSDSESEITISYFVEDAAWVPYYDIRAKDAESPLSLAFKATVYQNTGEDWNNVPMVLSTGSPALGGDLPELMPWYIDIHEPYVPHIMAAAPVQCRREAEWNTADAECFAEEAPLAAVRSAELTESMTGIEYTLTAPYTILSSAEGKSVDITVQEVNAKYIYKSVRKIEKDVFLVAEVGEWEHLNLLAGKANIFFEDKYVGEINLDPRKAADIFRISLGRDKNVMVTRIRGKDYTAPSSIGTSTKATREWTLTARNLKRQNIDIVIEDQIPVSVNKSVTVDAVNLSGAELDKDTGKLTWKFNLEPAGSKTLQVKYAVSYPKNKSVIFE